MLLSDACVCMWFGNDYMNHIKPQHHWRALFTSQQFSLMVSAVAEHWIEKSTDQKWTNECIEFGSNSTELERNTEDDRNTLRKWATENERTRCDYTNYFDVQTFRNEIDENSRVETLQSSNSVCLGVTVFYFHHFVSPFGHDRYGKKISNETGAENKTVKRRRRNSIQIDSPQTIQDAACTQYSVAQAWVRARVCVYSTIVNHRRIEFHFGMSLQCCWAN